MPLFDSRSLLLSAAIIAAPPVLAADHYLLVGGGADPLSSQVSIENNVLWIESLMANVPFSTHQVLFAAGPDGPPDVVLHAPQDPEVQRWLPLARVYGEQKQALSVFRRNTVPGNLAASTKARVTDTLGRTIGSLRSGDSLFLVYNGHGSFESSRDTSKNALRLWGGPQLNVREFGAALDKAPTGATVRYLLPQCFSGGFTRSLLRNPAQPRAADILPGRCGFFSVADNVEAEGCTPGVDIGEYRDYSTFFFAALAGRPHTGGVLARNPDRNGDGRVSLSEAHEYAYTESLSSDVPRATSEYYLELWQPWQARWQSFLPISPENSYAWRAQRLAVNLGLPTGGLAELGRAVFAQRRDLERRVVKATAKLAELHEQEKHLRRPLYEDFRHKWPEGSQPNASTYPRFITDQAPMVLEWIRNHPGYPALVEIQNRIERHDLALLELHRQAAGMARVQRSLELAGLYENFLRRATDQERRTYDALLACESWSLPEANQATAQ